MHQGTWNNSKHNTYFPAQKVSWEGEKGFRLWEVMTGRDATATTAERNLRKNEKMEEGGFWAAFRSQGSIRVDRYGTYCQHSLWLTAAAVTMDISNAVFWSFLSN